MGDERLTARIEAALRPCRLADWEVEEYAELLAALPADAQRRVLELVPSIWPVSQALAFSFLRNAARGVEVFGETRLQVWVGAVLDAYESGGLDEAQPLLADGGRAFLADLEGMGGMRYRAAAPLLQPYLSGLAGRTIDLAEGREAATDTAVVWLPRRMAAFPDSARNFLLYKLAAAVQWGHIAAGTYRAELPPGHPLLAGLARCHGTSWKEEAPCWLVRYAGLFPDPGLALRLYQAAATVRVAALLAADLPGLARDARPVLEELFAARPAPEALGGRGRLFEAVRRWTWLEGAGRGAPAGTIALLAPLRLPGAAATDAALVVAGLYPVVAALPEGEADSDPPAFEGVLRPSLAEERRLARREEARELFVDAFAALVAAREAGRGPQEPEEAGETGEERAATSGGVASVARERTGASGEEAAETTYVRIGAEPVAIPEEFRALVDEIREDLGGIPASYVSGVIARAGAARTPRRGPGPPEGPAAEEELVYDEWDFRRAGFRKDWCSLRRLELEPGDPEFTSRTVGAYRGPLLRIRRAFELMRTAERFLRRQRDGDELDVDAFVEARSDVAAGLPAPEELYVRLARDERDIATAFLVDMSSSTEGWVNLAIRESLVLLAESLEVLGDRYAVYGFSGTRRLRSELYHVKHFGEPYGAAVRGRIAAVSPRDYTRMGPPIRHLTGVLRGIDARARLLVILSDGKPEDYDEYKGDYAVEDTRHALLEAKAGGVHPFCITLDRQARDYVAHLYGEVNYVVIDDVAKLPLRVPEIYRALTV